MTFWAILGAVLSFLGSLPKIIDSVKSVFVYIMEAYRKYQLEKVSKELGQALDKATGEKKDTRDLEKIFNPDRTYPAKPPVDGK